MDVFVPVPVAVPVPSQKGKVMDLKIWCLLDTTACKAVESNLLVLSTESNLLILSLSLSLFG